MNYLFALEPLAKNKNMESATGGEPVIPAFPIQEYINSFLGLNTLKYASLAEVKQVTIGSIEFIRTLVDALVKQLPGIPQSIHEKYVMLTAKAVQQFKPGDMFSIFITPNSAKLRHIGDENIYPIWTTRPEE